MIFDFGIIERLLLLLALQCSYVCQQTGDFDQLSVCDVWRFSENANLSYVVSITVNDDRHFCSGVLVAPDWVLTSHSCFNNVITYIENISNLDETGRPLTKSLPGNPNCFDIKQQQLQILISTATDNCVWYGNYQSTKVATIPLFGVIKSNTKPVDVYLPDGVSTGSKRGNISIGTNDFLLLKLDGSFQDVPLVDVNILPFDRDQSDFNYDILSWIVNTVYLIRFGYATVEPEFTKSYSCGERFQQTVCRESFDRRTENGCDSSIENGNICLENNFVCADFYLPEISQNRYLLHTGDVLVRSWESSQAEIFGMFSEEFIPESLRSSMESSYYTYDSGNYSLEQNGALFIGFTENDISWVHDTIPEYTDTRCIIPKEVQHSQEEQVEKQASSKDKGLPRYTIVVIIIAILVLGIASYKAYCSIGTYRRRHLPYKIANDTIDSTMLSELGVPQGVDKISIYALKNFKYLISGGWGSVYKCEFQDRAWAQKQQVAVKVVAQQFCNEEWLRAILIEVDQVRRLNSDHIVRIKGVSLDVHPAIVMEYIRHGSLRALLSRQGYKASNTSLKWKLQLIWNISRKVQYLHQNSFAHRDLKPDNILVVDPTMPVVKISCLSFARFSLEGYSINTEQQVYISPEVQKNKTDDFIQADIWSLGAIMCEVLSGKVPENADFVRLYYCDINTRSSDECPKELEQLMCSCCNQDPTQRPTADAIVHNLTNIIHHKYNVEPASPRLSQSTWKRASPRVQNVQLASKQIIQRDLYRNQGEGFDECSGDLKGMIPGKIGTESDSPSSSKESDFSIVDCTQGN
eukprot:TRINITY_DN932_c1_g1_i2.p1 TRINITY_DN932_c1_g1~~TRINITY_DN932_c1_g1_i2.p1  ORF type:complete len:843 (-),score=34.87 TRINITY_DN932_c1_g1_i2:2105-4519(-)